MCMFTWAGSGTAQGVCWGGGGGGGMPKCLAEHCASPENGAHAGGGGVKV